MPSTSQKREWWAAWRCNSAKMVGVEFPGWSTPLLVADESAPAWELFASLMRKHGYFFRESAGGTYNCRYIGNNPAKGWSLHAYGIALDLNPSVNKYQTTQHDYPQGFIDDVLATGLFKWLHTFDPMHWEIDVPPSQIGETMFTPHETKELKRAVDALDEVGSNGSALKYMVLHLREGGKHWTRAQIAAIAAASAAGGASVSEVIQEIVRRLGG